MPADARRQSEDLVGDGAELDADFVFFHLLHDVRVPGQGEAVADAFCAEQQGVVEVAVGVGALVERLAAVEEEGDGYVVGGAFGLELEELFGEVAQRMAFALLADEVEAYIAR